MDRKQYESLSSKELNNLVEAICIRLNLFNREFPIFLPHSIKAIFEHPNLNRSDRTLLDTYCKMFELDWRGDLTVANKDQFMSTHYIYMNSRDQSSLEIVGNIDNKRVTTALRAACQPYLPNIVKKIKGTII